MVALVVAVRPAGGMWDGAASAGGGAPVTTAVRGAGAGATSTWGWSGASSRRRRPGSAVPSTGWWWPGCSGRAMPPGTAAPSTTPSPGWRCGRRSRRSRNCSGSAGARWGGSSPGSAPTPRPRWTSERGPVRSVRRSAPDRDRRDQLQARPPLPHRGGRPRQRPAGLGDIVPNLRASDHRPELRFRHDERWLVAHQRFDLCTVDERRIDRSCSQLAV
jgi:hypothetical protein